MEMSADGIVAQLTALVATYGLNVVAAIVILIIGWWAAGRIAGGVQSALAKTGKFDAMLSGFLASLVKYFILAFTVLAVLSQFGIQTASLIAVFGAAGLAIGLALQGTLSNLAAGVMLLLFRPFKVGDYIEAAGLAGTVKSVSLFVTEMATPDNVQILAPNAQIWGASIKNYSFHDTRRVDLTIGIAYEDDISEAMRVAHEVIAQDERALKEPEPMIAVAELGDNSVNLTVRVWSESANYWGLKFDLTKNIKERFDAQEISIPYPQRTIHLASDTNQGFTVAAE